MGGETCHQKGRERGPWYEIRCVRNDIIAKEAKGEDAKFERSLLRAWGKQKGWEDALQTPRRTRGKSKKRGLKGEKGSLVLRGPKP